jgi:2-succinyl-6-hydroxy-2,4-cyclohexadiene-1-carboxylate synthase
MGGRVALTYAVNHQNNIDAIILESTTAGLQNESERKSRILQDEDLSKRIEQNGIDDFVEYWTNLELFKSQKKLPIEVQQQIKIEKLKNNPTGLKNSLHGFGTGKMLSVWERLGLLQIPTLLITGEEDKKFNSISSEMVKLIPGAKHVIVENSGHNVHLEKPEVFVNLIKEFLISISHNKEDN